MPRASVSAADQQFIDHAATHGQVVTGRQLERWRGHGLLPVNIRHRPGRGRGSTSAPPPEAFDLVVWLAEHARPGRRPRDLAFGAFAAGLAVPEPTVRAAFAEAVDSVELNIARGMPTTADPEEIADAVVASGWRGSLIPARVRRIDQALAERGINWADPSLAALDPGFGSGEERATGNDWTFEAVRLLLAGGGSVDMTSVGALIRALLPAGAAAPLAGQVEYRWPISQEGDGADPLNDEGTLRALIPDGDMRDVSRQLALTTPLDELRDAWRISVELVSWAMALCDDVERELAADAHGPATEEWVHATLGLGRLSLTIALREPEPRPATIAIRALTLVFVRDMIRQLRKMWPIEGNFELLATPIAGPTFLTDFIRS